MKKLYFWFPVTSHIEQQQYKSKSRLSLIVWVNVVLNRTVFVDSDWRFDNLYGSHLQSQSELYHVSWWYYTLVIDGYFTLVIDTDSNTQTNSGPVTTATIPYIRGTSETIARILQPYNILVAHKPITTLRRLLTSDKDKDKPEDRQGAVYKIKCCDCQASYIGKTEARDWPNTNERRRMVTTTIIAEHHLKTKHQIVWDSATGKTYSTDYYQRLTLEAALLT